MSLTHCRVVNSTPMGVEIEKVSPGNGKTFPKAGNTLEMHYTGTLQKARRWSREPNQRNGESTSSSLGAFPRFEVQPYMRAGQPITLAHMFVNDVVLSGTMSTRNA